MASTVVEVFLRAKMEEFRQGLKGAGAEADKFFSKLEEHRSAMRKTALAAGAILAGEILFLKKVTAEAARQEAEENRLRVAIGNVAKARATDADMLIRQASAMQQVTKFGDEEIISAQAMLATFQLTGDQIAAMIPRLLDMAEGMEKMGKGQQDLQQLAILMGKAFTGQVGALSRYGVVISDDVKKSGDFNSILLEMDKNFKGAAEGGIKTFLGQLQQASNITSDMREQIGAVLIPALSALLRKIVPVILALTEWIKENQRLVAVLIGVGIAGPGLVLALSTLGLLLSGLPALFIALSGPLGWVALGFLAVAGAVVAFTAAQEKIPTTIEGIDKELAKLSKRLNELIEIQDEAGKRGDVSRFSQTAATESEKTKELIEKIDKLTKARAKMVEEAERQKTIQDALKVAMEGEKAAVVDLDKHILESVAALDLKLEQDKALKKLLDEIAPSPVGGGRTARSADLDAFVEETTLAMGTVATEADFNAALISDAFHLAFVEDIEGPARFFTDTFLTVFDELRAAGDNFVQAFGKAFAAAFIRVIRVAVESAVAEILVEKIKEMGKAGIRSILNPGNLLALAPIAAAAAAAVTALRAIEGQFAKKSFELGGVLPKTGSFFGHEGEIVFNPRRNTAADLAGFLADAGGGAVLAGSVNVFPSHYGDNYSMIDVRRQARLIGDEVRRAVWGK